MILVDTSIPISLLKASHAHHKIALDSIDVLRIKEREEFAVAPQILYEMYVVCTRPITVNGLGLAPQDALAEIVKTRSLFHLLPESRSVYKTWEGC